MINIEFDRFILFDGGKKRGQIKQLGLVFLNKSIIIEKLLASLCGCFGL